MKLLIDMNLSPRWVSFLGEEGIETTHWSQVGAAGAPDIEIMSYARRNNLVVLTHDLDFGEILAATQGKKPSVVQIRADDVRFEVIGGLLLTALSQAEGDLEQGALVTVSPPRTRIRILPLRSGGE